MKILDREMHTGLILTVLITIIFGCIILYSASSTIGNAQAFNLAYKQFGFALFTLIITFIIFMLDLKFLSNITWLLYLFSLGLLIAVFYIGKSSHGAQRWISLGFIAIQPSEIAKISIILALAKFMSSNIENNRKIHFIIGSSLIVILPLALIIKQPDLGTALTLIPILICMLFIAGIRKRYFIMILPFIMIPLMIFFLAKIKKIEINEVRELLFFLKPYQQNRLLVFIDSNIDPRGMSYNLNQSQIAIGSGGLLGKGFMAGTQTHLRFLPERHTDFIFSVLGEEWGFLGSCFLLLLYFIILRKTLSISEKCSDFFPKLAASGIGIMFLMHIVTNIGMTIGLMPITGLPLPFISYGGSSLLTTMIAIGLLLNFHANKERNIF